MWKNNFKGGGGLKIFPVRQKKTFDWFWPYGAQLGKWPALSHDVGVIRPTLGVGAYFVDNFLVVLVCGRKIVWGSRKAWVGKKVWWKEDLVGRGFFSSNDFFLPQKCPPTKASFHIFYLQSHTIFLPPHIFSISQQFFPHRWGKDLLGHSGL